MTMEPVTSPKNFAVRNKLKITKEALTSLSSHTRMFVLTKLQLHLIQWLRLNFTSARLIPTSSTVLVSKQSYHQTNLRKKSTLSKMMSRISIKVELSEWYTNHCIPASLFQHGMDAGKIFAITKQKDERSLTHYISRTTSAQNKRVQ